MREIEIQGSTRPHGMLNNDFIDWFCAHIFVLASQGRATNELISLAVGPEPLVHRYSIFMVNEFRFQTKELVRKTQNSGVLVRGDDSDSNKEYYGVLEDIYELCYVENRKVHLFKCHWDDVEPQTVLCTNDQENEKDNFINDNQTDVSGSEETEEELLDDDDGEDSDEYF
ncbi:hypothetical protein H5410_050977 [Solanum commersonii]|uniref:Uncharacterized protein n=1 Tax=Solanum commersonii TaxID=4109 RepID=A0A9J5WZD3_SOLCO|nr:hypothetical protein H5410_050977 [Solanum commersonii]